MIYRRGFDTSAAGGRTSRGVGGILPWNILKIRVARDAFSHILVRSGFM